MALLKDQKLINQLEYTPQGYKLKNTDGTFSYYENTPFGYNQIGTPMPTITHTPQPWSQPASTAVYTGQIVPQTSLPPINQIAKPSGLTKYDPTGQKVDSTTGRPVAIDEGRGQYYYTDTPNKWWDQTAPAPTVPSGPIPADLAGPQSPFNIKDSTSSNTAAAAAQAASEQVAKDMATRAAAADAAVKTDLTSQSSALTKKLLEEYEKIGGKAADTSKAEASIDPMRQAYADLNSQILSKNAEYKAIQSQYANDQIINGDRGATTGRVDVRNRQLSHESTIALNQKASEIGMLTAQALGMTGQIQAAEEAAKRAIDLKYAAGFERIEILKAQIEAIKPALDAEEKKAAAALLAQTNEEKAQLTTQKERDKAFHSTWQTGMNNSMPLNIGQQAQALYDSGNEPAALALMSKYTGTKAQDANAPIKGWLAGLTASQINATVNQIAGSLDNEPVVKEFNTMNAYISSYKNLGTSATDDQARIYTFAKVMDPAGSVKEGEYKTVQEYSQALLNRYGIGLKRVFTASGTLSPEARIAMGKTLETRFSSQRAVYDQVSNEYQRQINDTYAGKPRTITNYNTQSAQPQSNGPKLLQPTEIPSGYYQASDGLLYKR